MRTHRELAPLFAMDLLARTGYQLGKSPLLPLLAAALGAGPIRIGLIVGASTVVGALSKPLVGALSDRLGARPLLWVGTALFAWVPLLYLPVDGADALLLVRCLHGLATAIYGPVMASAVATVARLPREGRPALALYDLCRSAGYVLGPALGGWVFAASGDPRQAYLVVGAFGLAAFVPALCMSAIPPPPRVTPLPAAMGRAGIALLRDVRMRRATAVELAAPLGTRMVRTFWPLHAAALGAGAPWIGTVIALISAADLLAKPCAGWLMRRARSETLFAFALTGVALATPLLFVGAAQIAVTAVAGTVLGLCGGLLTPLGLATVAYGDESSARGARLGWLGALRNGGKAAGAAGAGGLVAGLGGLGAAAMVATLLGGVAVWSYAGSRED